ncbi:PLP-dependent aminotransferase family protein [Marinobacter alkaliphilus]|uniref:aminotransferase-like domain-containing protein n=2 Tax=Marinobacter TaxID=2742 RepID=UPI003D766C75
MGMLYNQVADQLQALILDGVYREGERVPGVRVLSRQFGVSISTVLQAHQTLEARGYLQARERSGYFVRRPARDLPEPRMTEQRSRPVPVSAREMTLDLCADEQKRMVPLATAIPHPDYLPVRQIQQSTLWAARRGLETLDYAFPGILQALEVVGLRVIEIPTHPSDGISLEGLQLALEQWPLKACVVVPNHSNPMGARMSDERKQQLVSMLAAAGVPLIEDDIYGDLFHTGERPRPAKAFDLADNVIYCSSFSKTISPGLRLGWMIPGRHMAAARQHKYFVNLATSTIPQLAVAHFLEQGGYDRYLRSARQHYKESTDRLRSAIARTFPEGTAVSRPQGGFVLWVQLPEGVSGTEVYHRARGENINVAPGRMFSTANKFDNCLRLNGGNPWTGRIEAAVDRLGAIAREVQSGVSPDRF